MVKVNTISDTVRRAVKYAGRICRLFAVLLMLLGCAIIYYFGEIIDLLGWDILKLGVFYGVHDIQRLLFLAPIIYAGYMAGFRGAMIATTLTLMILLPRAFIVSPFPDPVLRPLFFVFIAGTIGVLFAAVSRGHR